MRLPRVRFTMRRMMVAVAIVGMLLGVIGLYRRGERFRQIAANHASEAKGAAGAGWGLQRFDRNPDGSGSEANAKLATFYWQLHGHHKAMQAKYERAARYPWLAVEPDPPTPVPSPELGVVEGKWLFDLEPSGP